MVDLGGKRVLVVEDEAMVAMLIEDMLAELGCEVVGPAMRLEHALQLAETGAIDAAVLDINLGGVRSDPVADILERRGVPTLFVTGYGQSSRPGRTDRILQKPYRQAELGEALRSLLEVRG
ncbi:MAG: response regulator [Alphaproteobacteria bacterium]|nr:response regulator [Alphaproteobacteria bacterium]